MTTRLQKLILTTLFSSLLALNGFSQCGTTISSFPYTEGFETGFGGWFGNTSTANPPTNGTWGRRSGTTVSNFTGPTSANEGSFYFYTESSAQSAGTVLNLSSPCFAIPASTLPTFSFDYHMYADPVNTNATAMGTLELQVNTDPNGTGTWTTIFTLSGNQGNTWQSQNVSLLSYQGQTIQLRFKATLGSGAFIYAGDRAIDNLKLTTGIEAFPTYCAGGSDGSVITNTSGLTTPISYSWSNGATTSSINGVAAGTYTVTITDGTSSTYVLSETVLAGTAQMVNGLNYTESFETNDFGTWFNDTLSDQFDWSVNSGATPTGPTGPTGASDGLYYLYTESSGIGASEQAILSGPCMNLDGLLAPYFKFDYSMRVQGGGGSSADMGQLFLTADTTPSTPLSCDTIWFKSGAQGTSWLSDSVDLSAYQGQNVVLKFIGVISATGNVTQYGDRAVDNFEIKDAIQITDACNGTASGAINVTPLFGASPYSFSWSTGALGSAISGLTTGTYSVTITDNASTVKSYSIDVNTFQVIVPTGLNASNTEFCSNQLETVTLNIDYISGNATFSGSTAINGDYGTFGTVGSDLNYQITGTPALATGPGTLTISYRGDMEAPGEFVRSYSENGTLIGQTLQTNNQCSGTFSTTGYILDTDSLNYWAANDTISLFGQTIGMTRYCNAGGGNFYSWQAFYQLTYPYTT
ncbi:MAG: hypothetical protein NWS53_11495, partial [Salibacteraceae bacterium]|nr:hypothetical protein [Salibacteraceae bacterium]